MRVSVARTLSYILVHNLAGKETDVYVSVARTLSYILVRTLKLKSIVMKFQSRERSAISW